MGEANRRKMFRVINGGRVPVRLAPPRLVNHTLQIEQAGHEAIENLRAHVGFDSAHDFDLFLLGAGLGAVEQDGFLTMFKGYVREIERLRETNPKIPPPTIQQFVGLIVKVGMKEVRAAAKREHGAEEAPAASDATEIVREDAPAPADPPVPA